MVINGNDGGTAFGGSEQKKIQAPALDHATIIRTSLHCAKFL